MIIPGAPNPLLWGGGDPLDEYMKIERSLRFDRASSAYLSRTPGVSGSATTWTFSAWLKLSSIVGSNVYGIFVNHGDGSTYRDFIEIQSDQLRFDVNSQASSWAGQLKTNALFRDLSGHAHIQAVFDSTNALAAGRMRLYVNGVRITSFASAVYPAQGATCWTSQATRIHRIGVDPFAGSVQHFDGYLSEINFVDGQALEPTAFGVFHPRTGQWRPKKYAGTYGTNGFRLDFSDGSAATSSTLGKDRSGNNNDWTPTNISVTAGIGCDWMLDTPTNNYCVLNPLNAITSPATVSNGALDAATGSTGILTRPGSMPMTAGKWYWEVTPTAGTEWYIGIVHQGYSVDGQVGASGGGYSYAYNANKWSNSTNTAYGATYTTNDVIGVALDLDAGTLTFYKNGVSQGQAFSGISGDFLAIASDSSSVGSSSLSFNFGQRGFSYPPPTGFKALCTKNLAVTPPVMKSETAFVARIDSGANIAATLATARAGWADYIEIFKRRDAAEGWRWRFSDDSANYLDSSSTAAKAAFPSLPGTSYVGYALKVAAANGIATGRLTHTNGTPSVVTDDLANTRKAIILKNEATGVWYFYHPDLTAGKLVYLEQTTAETTDATISAVTASGFTVAAALASGTYRWIALAEASGCLSVRTYAANANADGPFDNGDSPAFVMARNVSIVAAWRVFDQARSTTNVVDKSLVLNSTSGEATEAHFDLVSNGAKVRVGGSSGTNGIAGNKVITLKFAAFPFRYANAR